MEVHKTGGSLVREAEKGILLHLLRNPIMVVLPSLLEKLGIHNQIITLFSVIALLLETSGEEYMVPTRHFQTQRFPGDHIIGLKNGRL